MRPSGVDGAMLWVMVTFKALGVGPSLTGWNIPER